MPYIEYDDPVVDQQGNSKFLNLVKKDDKIKIRLVTKPQSYFIHWVDGSPTACTRPAAGEPKDCDVCMELELVDKTDTEAARKRRKQMFVWGVIDRADNEAKVFKAGLQVFKDIAKYAKDESWGGPNKEATLFDITITRTERSPQDYYTVVPDPKSLTKEVTEEETNKVSAISTLIESVLPATVTDPVDEFGEEFK